MIEPAIFTEHLVKRYRKTLAVNGIDLSIPRGSICGLVGPNGAGKTSLIRMLIGLIPPTQGNLRVLGFDPTRASLEVRQRIGYVPEVHHIYRWMRVTQVLTFAGSVYRNWDRAECDRVVRLLGLPTDRKVRDLSRGELAKLALTIALAHRPELLILDEPTSGLDPLIRRDFLDAIRHLLRGNDGRTVFFSTHILSDIERIANRVIVMREGRIAADGSLAELSAGYTKASFLFDRPPPVNHDGEASGNGNGAGVLEISSALRIDKGLREWVAIFRAADATRDCLDAAASAIGARDCVIHPMTFEEVFVEIFNSRRDGASASGG